MAFLDGEDAANARTDDDPSAVWIAALEIDTAVDGCLFSRAQSERTESRPSRDPKKLLQLIVC